MHEVAAAEHVGAQVAVHQVGVRGPAPALLGPQEGGRRHQAGQLLGLRTTHTPW